MYEPNSPDFEDDPFQELDHIDQPILWDSNSSLQREQGRRALDRLDSWDEDRLAEFYEADARLLQLLHEYRFDDDGFIEALDPELVPREESVAVSKIRETTLPTETAQVGAASELAMSIESKVAVLERLAALRRDGDLTENEFESLKYDLIRSTTSGQIIS